MRNFSPPLSFSAERPTHRGGRVKAVLDLCRVSNLPTVWSNALAAQLFSVSDFRPDLFAVPCISLSFFYCAGMCLNDFCDVPFDRVRKPSRPIPSGRLSARAAFATAVVFFAAALLLLMLFATPLAVAAGCGLTGLIVAYDLFHKRSGLTVLLMAGCRAMIFLVVSAAVSNEFLPQTLAAGAVHFAYTVGISAVARYEFVRGRDFRIRVVPLLIAGMSIIDGLLLAVWVSPAWGMVAAAGFPLTLISQWYVRGD